MNDLNPRSLTADDVERIMAAQDAVDQDAIVVRPHKDNSGIPGMDEVLRSLPRADTESAGLLGRGERNTSTPFAFEMRYAPDPIGSGATGERVLSLQYVGGDDRTSELLGRQLPDKYPDSRTEHRDATWLTPDEGQHIVAATLGLRRYTLYPLKNIDLDEFRSDPTGSILTEMVGAADAGGVDADVAVQVMARPAGTDWKRGVEGGYGLADAYGGGLSEAEERVTSPLSTEKLRWFLNEPNHERRAILPTPVGSALGWLHPFFRDEFEHPPSKADKQAAKMLSDLDGRGWEFHVRIVAVSDDAELARERVESTAEMFDNFYEYRGAQTFVPIPQNGSDAVDVATAAAGREWPTNPEQRKVKPQIEVAGLTNIPEAEHVSTNKLRWALASPGEGIPPGTARFNYDTHGIDPSTASREEKQVAMLEAAGDDEPIWYGTGVKYGTEAGVFQDSLYHQFVGGATRQGKTTLLTNFTGQSFRGSGGGLVIDPKGLDADEFIAEWPEDRDPEDIITMDLSGEFDRIPRFNFMEIPDYLEPGTRAHRSYCEALAEDILAMVAEAGGSDKYMGALMKRVVKAVVRGLAKSGQTATLLDVAAVCASSENLSRFRKQMADERFEFLRDTAERLEQRDDTDLEPLAGRMDEWVLNENVRELICARESSFSIDDLVEDGKWLIVGFDKASSEDEVTMVGTALIRRTYFAQRHHNPDRTFDLICDEFDRIASEESNIHSILSEAAAFDYRCTLACQAPTNQLPERVRHAIENQCGTFLSFNPGGGKDAAWISQQHTVEKDELLNLPRFKFYMRATTRDDDLTHSFMVEGFPPAREARGDPRTEQEIRELKEASLDKYGATVDVEEQRAASPFFGSGGGDASDEVGTADEMDTEDQTAATVAAIHEQWLSSAHDDGDSDRWVDATSDEMVNRMARYVDESITDSSMVWDYYQPAEAKGHIEHRKNDDGDDLYRATDDGLAEAWANAAEGNRDHRFLIADTHALLMGYDIQAEIVTGPGEPDAIGELAEHLRLDTAGMETGELLRAAEEHKQRLEQDAPTALTLTGGDTANVEAESSTGSTGQRQTVLNLAKAYRNGRKCIFACRSDVADKVVNTLSDPPLAKDESGDIVTLYNHTQKVSDNGITAVIPNTDTVTWKHNAKTGKWWVANDEGDRVATFDRAEDIYTDLDAYPDTTETLPDETYAADGPHLKVAKPVTAEEYFEESWNTVLSNLDDAYVVLDVPEGARRDPTLEASLVTDHHERVPLSAIGRAEGDDDSSDDTTDTNDEDDEMPVDTSLESLRIQ